MNAAPTMTFRLPRMCPPRDPTEQVQSERRQYGRKHVFLDKTSSRVYQSGAEKLVTGLTTTTKEVGMRRRLLEVIGIAAIVIAIAGLLVVSRSPLNGTAANAAGTSLKTAWNEPDLQGIWTDPYQTPLQ